MAETSASTATGPQTYWAQGINPAGTFWLVAALLSGLPLFWFGFESLAAAWSTPEYSHGPVIPMLSFYMYLREMKQVPPTARPVHDRWPGVLVAGLGIAMAILGNLVRIPDIVTYGLIVWIAGLILVTYGYRRGMFFWASVLHLVFMLPLPQFVYWQLTIQLQFISSEIGVWFVRMAGIPVYLDGNVIDLGVYKLLVAEACSGLRYLFPIMSFSYVFAILYNGPVWHKWVLLLAAAPITVLMNSFRIGVIGVLVDSYGIGHAEGFLHFFEGWIIFIACVLLLFGLAVLLKRMSGDKRPLADAIDMDFTGLRPQLARGLRVVPSAALIAMVVLTAGASAMIVVNPARETIAPERDSFNLFPGQLGAWTGRQQFLEPEIERVLGADDYFAAGFVNPAEAAPVDFFVAYYERQTEGSGIHSPEVCLPAGGWEIFTLNTHTLEMGETSFGEFQVNRAIIQRGLDQQLVYYWFENRGRRLTNDYLAKFYTVADSLTMGRTDGALVRVITPIMDSDVTGADARLQAFLGESLDRLPRFVPE